MILELDPSATYWLLQLHHLPKLLSVPAKVLAALAAARHDPDSLTVNYSHVRSSAVGLGTELVDLLIGQWIGVPTEQIVALASGEDSRHVPACVLSLEVRVTG
jgi:hypothetical protein